MFKPLNFDFQLTEKNSSLKCVWEIPVTLNDKIRKYLESKDFIFILYISENSETNRIQSFSEPIGVCKVSLFELISNNKPNIIRNDYNIIAKNNAILGKITMAFQIESIGSYDKGALDISGENKQFKRAISSKYEFRDKGNEYVGLRIHIDSGKKLLCPPNSKVFCEIGFPYFMNNIRMSNYYKTKAKINSENPKFNHTFSIVIPRIQTNSKFYKAE